LYNLTSFFFTSYASISPFDYIYPNAVEVLTNHGRIVYSMDISS